MSPAMLSKPGRGGWNPAQGAGVRRCRQTLPSTSCGMAPRAPCRDRQLHALSAGAEEIIRRELAAK